MTFTIKNLFPSSRMKIMGFFLENPEEEFNQKEIIEKTDLSKLTVMNEMKDLIETRLILIKKEYGKSSIKNILKAMADINDKGLEILPKYGVSENIIKEIETVINAVNDIREENYEIIFDFTLVRGMGYYTGSIFEISYKNLGYSIAGGGRYDEMIGNFIGEKIPAIGFSIGFERLANQLIKEKFKVPGDEKLVMLYDESDNYASVIKAADKFRDKNYIVGLYERRNKMGKQLNRLYEQGYGKFTIFSEVEEEMEISELNED